MPRPATGTVIEKSTARGLVFALRFRAYGQRRYVTLGTTDEGWTRGKADDELRLVLAQVARGVWMPPEDAPPAPAVPVDPVFLDFASEWLEEHGRVLAPNTLLDYRWQLTDHLLPFFAEHRLSTITVAEVDRYRNWKLRQGKLGPTSINKTITRLGQILDVAEERELIGRNPVRKNPRKRKVPTRRPARPYLDQAGQIEALLIAGADLDAASVCLGRRPLGRRAMLATMILAGLRVGELCALRWQDVDLAAGRLRVTGSKTDAGVRTVELLPLLREELTERKASLGAVTGTSPVFATDSGKPRDRHNVRERVVKRAAELASERLAAAEAPPLPALTPHALRRTFASVLVALGHDPAYVMAQIGHTDPGLTLTLYAKTVPEAERERLRRLVEGADAGSASTESRVGEVQEV